MPFTINIRHTRTNALEDKLPRGSGVHIRRKHTHLTMSTWDRKLIQPLANKRAGSRICQALVEPGDDFHVVAAFPS